MSNSLRLYHNTLFIKAENTEKVQVQFYVVDKNTGERADVQTVILNNIIEYVAFRELLANLPSIEKKIIALKDWQNLWEQQISNIEEKARGNQSRKIQKEVIKRRQPTFEDIKNMLR
jgi:hypothetical protein